MLSLPDSIRVERHGAKIMYLCEGVNAEAVLAALKTPGDMLKNGNKRIVRKVDGWVIKESLFNKGIGPLKMTINPKRYRNGWLSSLEMMRLGLPIPRTIAYVEHRVAGVIWKNTFVYEYIENAVTLAEFTRSMDEDQRAEIHQSFFKSLASVLQQLVDTQVIHRDLKPMNILTANGGTFYVIDLDEAYCNTEVTSAHRLRNQVQIVDGMRDLWTRDQYNVLLDASIPVGEEAESWKKRVWEAVDARGASGKRF